MDNHLLGEFLGTLVLVYLGNGIVANALLKKSLGESAGWLAITAGWAFAVIFGIIVSLAVGGLAHINPAITIAVAMAKGDWSNVLPFATMQMLGAFCGATLVWLTYLPHWKETENEDLKRACFCTAPAIRNTPTNILTEFLGTLTLIVAGMAIGTQDLAPGMPALLWGLLVWSIGLSLGGPTGYSINPARDLGPRIAHALLPISGKGNSDWKYGWVPLVGHTPAALVGGFIIKSLGII